METIRLVRLETSEQGTFGRLYAKEKTWFSAELPWKENKAQVSSIPPGRYKCVWTWSPTFKRKLYTVFPVSGRAGIRVHAGNFVGSRSAGLKAHSYGCILLGTKLGKLDGQKAVLCSVTALREFEKTMDYRPFNLEIMNESR